MRAKRRRRGSGPSEQLKAAMDTALRLIGQAPKEQLAWAVGAVQRFPKEMLPGEWNDLKLALAAFARFSPAARKLGHGGMTAVHGQVDTPTDEEARDALKRLGEIIQKAVRRETIATGLAKIEATLWWDERAGRFWPWEVDEDADWKLLATRALGLLIAECGHLLKECPAPDLRAKAGETCGVWFVAKRPNQEYCSATCQSRASTRAAREGTETPASLKRRQGQKKGGE